MYSLWDSEGILESYRQQCIGIRTGKIYAVIFQEMKGQKDVSDVRMLTMQKVRQGYQEQGLFGLRQAGSAMHL